LANLFQPRPTPGLARFFLRQNRVTKISHCGTSSLLRIDAGSDFLGNQLIEMELNLAV